MKKSLLATTFVAFPLSAKTTRLRNYGCIAIVLLAGCTATQTRWDATNIRKEVMVYYNDEIMENLISAKNKLPFVHVDITLLTSQGSSQISGSIGDGETTNNTGTQQLTRPIATNTSGTTLTQTVATTTGAAPSTTTTNTIGSTLTQAVAGAVGVVSTVTHVATRPFSYSVTPQQTETLSIQAAPALGSQAIAEMSLPMTVTKQTDEFDGGKPKKLTKVTNEKTPTPVTIYKLYDDFADHYVKYVKERLTRPSKDAVLPGTVIKLWDAHYYYIDKNAKNDKGENAEDAYYKFCTALFTKGQSQTGGLERALQQTQAAAALPIR